MKYKIKKLENELGEIKYQVTGIDYNHLIFTTIISLTIFNVIFYKSSFGLNFTESILTSLFVTLILVLFLSIHLFLVYEFFDNKEEAIFFIDNGKTKEEIELEKKHNWREIK